jgi:hypothetical protein
MAHIHYVGIDSYDSEAEKRISSLIQRGVAMQRDTVGSSPIIFNRTVQHRGHSVTPKRGSVPHRTDSPRVGTGPEERHASSRSHQWTRSTSAASSGKGAEKAASIWAPPAATTAHGAGQLRLTVDGAPVPDCAAVAMYRQERDDRMFVERLFIQREEYHSRQHVMLGEAHQLDSLRSLQGFEWKLVSLRAEHRFERDELRLRIEDSTNVGRLRKELAMAQQQVELERSALATLQRELELRDGDRRSLMHQERVAWEEEKVSLLGKLASLEAALHKLRTTGTALVVPAERATGEIDSQAHGEPVMMEKVRGWGVE